MDVWRPLDSPVGVLLLTATDGAAVGPGDGSSGGALTGIYFQDHRGGADARVTTDRLGQRDEDHPVLVAAAGQLAEYFEGTRTEFDLPLAAVGTAFQHRVWDALLEIPYGRTASYGDIARRLGLGPAASRAVGLANGANPISIVVPCHRVIGANGTLTGYGGGLERKQFLLDLEGDQLF